MSDIDYFLLKGPAPHIITNVAGDFIKCSHEIPNISRDKVLASMDVYYLGEAEYEYFLFGDALDVTEVQSIALFLHDVHKLPITQCSDSDRCLTRSLQMISTDMLLDAIGTQNDWRKSMGKNGELMLAVRGIGMKVRLFMSWFGEQRFQRLTRNFGDRVQCPRLLIIQTFLHL